MFNRARFNRQRYNLTTTQAQDIALWAEMDTWLRSLVALSDNVHLQVGMTEDVRATVQFSPAVVLVTAMDAVVQADTQGRRDYMLALSLSEVAGAQVAATSNLFVKMEASEEVSVRAVALVDLWPKPRLDAAMAGSLLLGKNYSQQPIAMDASMHAQVTTIRFDHKEMLIDLELRPGDVLVIDSNTCVVLRNEENVIWAHSGDWLYLDRDTHDVEVVPLGGYDSDISKRILYTERWV